MPLEAARRPIAVECLPTVEDWEEYAEKGMRLLVTGGIVQESDVAKLTLDYASYDEFNRPFESSNYYDSNRNPTLTARQAGKYKAQDCVYVNPEDDVEQFFTLLDGAKLTLLAEYDGLPDPRPGYVPWLESLCLDLRAKAAA